MAGPRPSLDFVPSMFRQDRGGRQLKRLRSALLAGVEGSSPGNGRGTSTGLSNRRKKVMADVSQCRCGIQSTVMSFSQGSFLRTACSKSHCDGPRHRIAERRDQHVRCQCHCAHRLRIGLWLMTGRADQSPVPTDPVIGLVALVLTLRIGGLSCIA
jgi:hypothetical protein